MCVIVNCAKQNDPRWQDGGVGEICTDHYNEFAGLMRMSPSNPAKKANITDESLLNDLIKLHVLMNNMPLVLAQLQQLNRYFGLFGERGRQLGFGGAKSQRVRSVFSTSNYARLSTALTYFEHKCWFPSTHLVACGILPADVFLRLLRCGYMLKDVGAGAAHGEFSHRLQWHAVMRVATNNFTVPMAPDWHYSPYHLYSLFGEGELYSPRALWGTVFDDQTKQTFNNPRRLDEAVRAANMGFLSRQLTNLYDRRSPMELRSTEYADTASRAAQNADNNGPNGGGRPTRGQLAASIQAKVAQDAYRKHKGLFVDNEAMQVLRELGLHKTSWANWMGLGNTYEEVVPVQMEGTNGALLIRVDDRLIEDDEVPARRAQSQNELQLDAAG
jgi:hypothetical protein